MRKMGEHFFTLPTVDLRDIIFMQLEIHLSPEDIEKLI